MSASEVYTVLTTVDEYGVIYPTFKIPDKSGTYSRYTGGQLKYFFPMAGKRVKVTVEILEEE